MFAVEPCVTTFNSCGTRCAGSFYAPSNGDRDRLPCVVLGHGLGGIQGLGLTAFARRFAEAGVAAFTFDYRFFGDSCGRPRQLVDHLSQLDDWRAAVAHVRALPEIDADRVALWGTSLGGAHVIALAAEDSRIAAVVSLIPFAGARATSPGIKPLPALGILAAGLRDQLHAWLGMPPHYIPLCGTPGTVAAITAPGALNRLEALTASCAFDNRFTPRVLLKLWRYDALNLLRCVSCPVLFCLRRDLSATSTQQRIRRHRSKDVAILSYAAGPFGLYLGAPFELAVSDQSRFLTGHLLDRARSS
ncbi:MAG: alpha/beta hydrolase [Solirubrobacteraceae bacterium]